MSCLSGAAVLGLWVAKLAGYGFEEVTAPNANQQSRPEEDYGVKASEVAAGPIDTLLDVQPERGFIQSKSGANTVEQGHQATDQKRRRLGSFAHFDQLAKSHCQQKKNAPDEVVDMRAANVNVMKRGDVAVSAVSHASATANVTKNPMAARKSRRFGRSRTYE